MKIEDDPAWQLLARSKQFILSAKLLRDNARENEKLLRTPMLHLLGHGIEVFLKHDLVRNGQAIDDLRKKYGHNLKRLWSDTDSNLKVKLHGMCERALDDARASGQFVDEDWGDPLRKLDEYLKALSVLHDKESGYTLRYLQSVNTMGPRPHMLIDTFLPVIEDVLSTWKGFGKFEGGQ
ncbi:MAG: hypothetical protein AB7L90_18695 [Hyphomicrobiaceae bacterium]